MENNVELPDVCYVHVKGTATIAVVKRGDRGYYPYTTAGNDPDSIVDELNNRIGVTKGQAQAMLVGSMFGWDVPGADPNMYTEEGKIKK